MLATAQRITDDPWLHDKVLAQSMGELIAAERDDTPAERICALHDLVCRNLGVTDPWHKAREEWTEELATFVDPLEARLDAAADPLGAALLAAARANVFDDELLSGRTVREELRRTGARDDSTPDQFAFSDLDRFRKELAGARSLLLLHDSGPELLFDIALIRRMRAERPELEVTSVVRAQPILLDATREDAERAGLDRTDGVVAVVDPGVRGLGISLETSNREFREQFEGADLVLAKGQAHIETLSDCGRPVYFLFRIKCSVMARQQGSRIGELVFVRG